MYYQNTRFSYQSIFFFLHLFTFQTLINLNEGCIPYHFINLIDSRISGLNISKYMIEKYQETEKEIHLFPFEIMSGSEYYWKKYFMEKS